MEKRVLGMALSVLGIAGLIYAAVCYVNGGTHIVNGAETRDFKAIIAFAVLGLLFFFAGIGLVKNTKDRPT
jgi:hypothetical protein